MTCHYEKIATQDSKFKPNIFSRLLFCWLNGLFLRGYRKPLKSEDLFSLFDENKAQGLVNNLYKLWKKEVVNAQKRGKNPRLWKAILKLFPVQEYLLIIALKLTEDLMTFAQTFLIWYYLKFLKDNMMNSTHACLVVAGTAATTFLKILSYHHYANQTLSMGMRLKIAVIGVVNKKIVESRRNILSMFTSGHILNLVSNDAQRMEKFVKTVPKLLSLFWFLTLIAVSMVYLVGLPSLYGMLVIFLIVIIIFYLSYVFAELRCLQSGKTDKRLGVVSEIISGIRALKMYAWEWNYKDEVQKLRRDEVNTIQLKTFVLSLVTFTQFTIKNWAILVSLVALFHFGIHLDTSEIFTLTILFGIVGQNLEGRIGLSARTFRDGIVSLIRLEKFLCTYCQNETTGLDNEFHVSHEAENFEYSKMHEKESRISNDIPGITLTEVSATWNNDQQSVFHNVSLSVESNQLMILTGRVGSGKSSLLMAILGEIPTISGQIKTNGRIAYVSQIPWIFSGTIRENVLFGQRLDEARYNRILEICDLQKDIKCFREGDLTIIGQRGVGLSGGQRARVSLARAVYSDADVFLLDDLLSAVDVRVGQHIFDKCICGELSNRVRILVTHQIQHLERADKIVVLDEGVTQIQGSYAELKNEVLLQNLQEQLLQCTEVFNVGQEKFIDSVQRDMTEESGDQDLRESDEDRATGTVSWRLYWEFFRVGLPAVLVGCLVLFCVIVQASLLIPNWWLSRVAHMPFQKQKSSQTLGIFGGLTAIAFLLSLAREIFIFFAILRSTRKLHDKMTLAVIKSPVLFFDTNPAGRIMNRFAKDIGNMDDQLPLQFDHAVTFCLNVISVFVFAPVVNPWITIAVVPICVLFYLFTRIYLKTARELKRMEAIRCSPVYAHVVEIITGLEVIRTSGREEDFLDEMVRIQDDYTKAFFLSMSSVRWYGLYLDLLCSVFTIAISIAGVTVIQDHALTGMLLSFATTLLGDTQHGLRMACEVESQMTSVERVMTYSKLPSEPGYSRQNKPPEDWPSQGGLSLRDVSMVYVDGGPCALKDVNIDVLPKENIGIAGRTGAGKSSIVASLFRMPDPQGQVLIDGIDLGTIDIQSARRSMAVITQDPVLFAGSIKKNLDPFNHFTEQEIWTALEEVQLKNKISNLVGKLGFCVGEGGSGFSVGERQLLCLARALLQKSKILVLDEATANVDYITDQLIQKVIRQKFTNCTVLTIAHRVNTIMDYDKVVVLDQGQVVEYDNPRNLAGKENGFFACLINNTVINSN